MSQSRINKIKEAHINMIEKRSDHEYAERGIPKRPDTRKKRQPKETEPGVDTFDILQKFNRLEAGVARMGLMLADLRADFARMQK